MSERRFFLSSDSLVEFSDLAFDSSRVDVSLYELFDVLFVCVSSFCWLTRL